MTRIAKLAEVKRVVIHHSAGSRTTTPASIRHMHMHEKNPPYRDVGYHFLIDGHGVIHVGRPIPEMGAHARGANRDSIGICVIGHNGQADWAWSQQQRNVLTHLCAALRVIWPTIEFYGHRDVGTTKTECPGVDISRDTGLPKAVWA